MDDGSSDDNKIIPFRSQGDTGPEDREDKPGALNPRESAPPEESSKWNRQLEILIGAGHRLTGHLAFTELAARLLEIIDSVGGSDYAAILFRETPGDDLLLQGIRDKRPKQTGEISKASKKWRRQGLLPELAIDHVASSGEIVRLQTFGPGTSFAHDPYFRTTPPAEALCIQIAGAEQAYGVIYLESSKVQDAFTENRVGVLEVIAGEAAVAVENSQIYRQLEETVNRRLSTISTKDSLSTVVLENLEQGILTILPGCRMGSEYSNHLEGILETAGIAEANIMDVVFSKSDLPESKRSEIEGFLDAAVGSLRIQYDLNDHILPREILWNAPSGKKKILSCEWVPLIGQEGRVESILLTLKDCTSMRELERLVHDQNKELNMIGEVLTNSRNRIESVVRECLTATENCEDKLRTNPWSQDLFHWLYTQAHTIKGTANVFRLTEVAEKAHLFETLLASRNRGDSSDDRAVEEGLSVLHAAILGYDRIMKEIANFSGDKEQSAVPAGIDEQGLMELLEKWDVLADDERLVRVSIIAEQFMELRYTHIYELLEESRQGIDGLAHSEGIENPKISVIPPSARIPREFEPLLTMSLVHLLSNSISHGIEDGPFRENAGKNTRGSITITVVSTTPRYTLEYIDDGRGLDMNAIRTKATEKGIKIKPTSTEVDIANLIFRPRFSTRSKVAMAAGRGVGLNAIKRTLEHQGGSITIVPLETAADSANGFLPVKFVVVLPEVKPRTRPAIFKLTG